MRFEPNPGRVNSRSLAVLLAILLTLAALPAWAAGSLIISEFRLQGPSGFADEFIEIYNDSGTDHTVAAISGTGYAIAASDGIVRCTIPNGTVIPTRRHWLCANSVGYSLSGYPAGTGTTATADGTYTTEITNVRIQTVLAPTPCRPARESRSSTTTPAAGASSLRTVSMPSARWRRRMSSTKRAPACPT